MSPILFALSLLSEGIISIHFESVIVSYQRFFYLFHSGHLGLLFLSLLDSILSISISLYLSPFLSLPLSLSFSLSPLSPLSLSCYFSLPLSLSLFTLLSLSLSLSLALAYNSLCTANIHKHPLVPSS